MPGLVPWVYLRNANHRLSNSPLREKVYSILPPMTSWKSKETNDGQKVKPLSSTPAADISVPGVLDCQVSEADVPCLQDMLHER
ncbi:hypothetical protein JRQ81_009679 [Phrynocephalus forsythii]|uniref:Uncharacterized protein n=1 Tax=Phrynocephalus forsythii TaxID=171643 RepID=A0A9Q0Y5H9_9SAUR|nr:hypothetical protein JRQ81_009679 [Phrynocephalus forsythii]